MLLLITHDKTTIYTRIWRHTISNLHGSKFNILYYIKYCNHWALSHREEMNILQPTSNYIFGGFLPGFYDSDVYIFWSSCLFFSVFYFSLESYMQSPKAKSWLIMMAASAVLSITGTFYVLQAEIFSLWTEGYVYSDNPIPRALTVFFLASMIMDIGVGVIRYRAHLDPFSAVFHHIFYTVFVIAILRSNYTQGFCLNFFMEVKIASSLLLYSPTTLTFQSIFQIPTFLLAIGSVWSSARSDLLFGFCFLVTRILFNTFFAYKLYTIAPTGLVWKVCLCVLCLHLHWFSKW